MHDAVLTGAGHHPAIRREGDLVDGVRMNLPTKQDPIACQVPERDLPADLAPHQLRADGGESYTRDPARRTIVRDQQLDLAAGQHLEDGDSRDRVTRFGGGDEPPVRRKRDTPDGIPRPQVIGADSQQGARGQLRPIRGPSVGIAGRLADRSGGPVRV